MNRHDLYMFLNRSKLGVVSTLSAGGIPQSALIGYAVSPSLEIIFDTLSTTRKFQNLLAHPQCSFVAGWTEEQTLQYQGRARKVLATELPAYQEIYFSAWPQGREHLRWPHLVYVVIEPHWIRFSDFDHTPPLIVEFTFP